MKQSGIYKITCLINDKKYIGSAINIEARWCVHKKARRAGVHHNIHLQRAWCKYGEEKFSFDIIELVGKELLIIREQFYMDMYDSHNYIMGYNICKTAGNMLGFKFSEKSKSLLRERRLGYTHSDETKAKIGASHLGMKYDLDDEKRQNIRNRMIGNKICLGMRHTQASREKMSKSQKGKKRCDETRRKMSIERKTRGITAENQQKMQYGRSLATLSDEARESICAASRGENNTQSKLTESDVREIKVLLARGDTLKSIARQYNVANYTIGLIKQRKTWKHII